MKKVLLASVFALSLSASFAAEEPTRQAPLVSEPTESVSWLQVFWSEITSACSNMFL